MLNRRQLLTATGSGLAMAGFFPAIQPKAWAQGSGKSYSLHVGVNKANPAAYPGGISQLAGCVNDAKSYRQMAIKAGFNKSHLLTDQEATIDEVSRYIYHAASHAASGDIFFVSYAGHGTGVPDRSNDEPDRQDEAWCLYDGLLLDDFLYSLWAQFKPGVRLLLVSDSCHSGSVARVRAAARGLALDLGAGDASRTRGILPNLPRGRDLDGSRAFATRLERDGRVDAVAQGTLLRPRTISPEQAAQAYRKNEDRYLGQERAAAGANNPAAVDATGILLAGCQDHELSWENSGGSPGGLFTRQMELAFGNRGTYDGYSTFLNHIQRQMPNYQTPNFFPFGREQDDFFNQTPFTV